MSKHDITIIVVAIVLKELLTSPIRKSKTVAMTVAKYIGSWTLKCAFILELMVDVGIIVLLGYLFFTFPRADEPVTHDSIRFQIFLAVLVIASCSSAIRSWRRWRAGR